MQEQVNNDQDDEFNGELPYVFLPSISRTRTVKGKKYIVRSYFKGGNDFNKTVTKLAVKRAYNQ